MKRIMFLSVLLFVFPCLVLGQTTTKADTAQLDPKLLTMYQGLFDKAWSQKFAELWNINPDTAKVFGGMGKVHFVSLGTDTVDALMNFDSTGKAAVLGVAKSFPKDTLPAFSALLEKWAEFMEGKFGAVKGVMTGKIKFQGNWAVAFKYGFKFDKVAPVGKRASELISQKKKK